MPAPRPVAVLAVLACAALGLLLTPGVAPAATSPSADGPGSMVLVLDSSGSMKEATGGGGTKIGAAKQALRRVVDALPADQEVGLRVYGAEVFSRNDPGACEDSQLVVPLGTDNRSDLRRAVASYQPYGETPTGFALQEAGKDLGDEGQRSIVLVSDGEPTCEPDPCVVARDLRKQGIDLRIDVVGMGVDGAARETLQCIADAGGGLYYDADSADELTASLTRLAERSARAYQVVGQPVEGTADRTGAPEITAGDWSDTVSAADPVKHYRVRRELQDSVVIASAAFRTPHGDSFSFNRLRLETPDGQSCDASGEIEQLSTGVLLATAVFTGPWDAFGEVDTEDPCLTSRDLVLAVQYTGDATEAPVELRVSELPALADPASLPPAPDEVSWSAPDRGAGKERDKATGGVSFADPEPLTPGHYRGTIVPGETLTFATPLEWGQQLDATVRVPALAGPLAPAAEGGPMVALEIYSPARAAAGSTETEPKVFAKDFLSSRGDRTVGSSTGPVSLGNVGDVYLGGSTHPGDYVVTLFVEDTEENASLPVPFTLDLGVVGDPVAGPEFDERPYEEETTESPTVTPSADGDTDLDTAAAESEDGAGYLPWLVAGIAALLVLAGVLVLMRRRRARTD